MSGEVETAKDLGEAPADVARRWLKELELSGQHEEKWRKRSVEILKRYRDEDRQDGGTDGTSGESRFNILFANTEVLKGVMYQRQPVPDVRRRFLDKDPIARQAALILQRALSYSADSYDFDGLMRSCVEDVLLPGRGVGFVKYVPTMGTVDVRIPLQSLDPKSSDALVAPDGTQVPLMRAQRDDQGFFQMAQEQRVVYEAVECDYVEWDMFRISPAKRWTKVRWVAFGELMTRDDLEKQFGEVGKLCELHWSPQDKDNDELFKRALVWAIWNKTDRKVYFVSEGLKSQPLKVLDDPLSLEAFFPCPKPVYSISTTTNLIPVPEYTQYQDQACELDEITQRIEHLIDGLRRRGLYDSTYEELAKLKTAGDNEFIPVENLAKLLSSNKEGLSAAIFEEPIEVIAQVVAGLYTQRDQIKQTIYEITGIADIVRGSTKATETLGAQELKSRYANVRTGPRQGLIAKFARDVFRLKAEIISERFDPTTLKLMTGPDLWMVEQEVQGAGGQVTRQKVDATQQIMELLRNEKLRGFRVDVETDSTIQPDATEEQKNRIEFLGAITNFVTTMAPAVQSGTIPLEVAREFMSFGARAFKVSPQMEEALDKIGGDSSKPDPAKQQQEQMQQQMMQADMATKNAGAAKAQAEAQEAAAKAYEAMAKAMMVAAQAQALGLQLPQMPGMPSVQQPAAGMGMAQQHMQQPGAAPGLQAPAMAQ